MYNDDLKDIIQQSNIRKEYYDFEKYVEKNFIPLKQWDLDFKNSYKYKPRIKPPRSYNTPYGYLYNYFYYYQPMTFYIDGKVQCDDRRNRSINDLYYILKAKFPEVTLHQTIYYIGKIAEAGKINILACPNIHRIVAYKCLTPPNLHTAFQRLLIYPDKQGWKHYLYKNQPSFYMITQIYLHYKNNHE